MKLKDDNRAGLFYALNSNDEYISAADAISGKPYKCPVCSCPMHVTTTRGGKKIFARNPKTQHTNPQCITIENKKVEKTFEFLDPFQFISSLCHAAPQKKPGKPRSNGSPSGDSQSEPENEDESEIMKLSSFSSLRQVAESTIPFLNSDARQGNHLVSDFVVTYKTASDFFANNTDVMARIFYARYSWINFQNQAIIFSLFTKTISVKFVLIFTKRSEFVKYYKKFVHFLEGEKGKTICEKIHDEQDVLIASDDWVHLSREQCSAQCSAKKEYCKKCKGMYQAVFTSSKQIYLLTSRV